MLVARPSPRRGAICCTPGEGAASNPAPTSTAVTLPDRSMPGPGTSTEVPEASTVAARKPWVLPAVERNDATGNLL